MNQNPVQKLFDSQKPVDHAVGMRHIPRRSALMVTGRGEV
jgi:hypothetical protein